MFDSHVHYDAEPFADLDTAARRAREAGIRGALNPAVGVASSRAARAIHERHPWILPCAGMHPLYLDGFDGDGEAWGEAAAAEIEALARAGAAAVGEAGLDFWHGRADEPRQREALFFQADLARRCGLPLILHMRKAFYETLSVLKEAGFEGAAVCHAFSGSWDMAAKALDRGYSLSAAANLTYPRKAALRELFRRVPADRLLVETDAPDIPPWTRRGEVHNPWDLPLVVEALAAARGERPEAVAEVTEANARRLFTSGSSTARSR